MSEASFHSLLPFNVLSNLSEIEAPNPVYTVDTALDSIGLGTFHYIVLLLTGLCWTAESMEMLLLSFIKQPLQCEWAVSDSQIAVITTVVGIGMLVGGTFWGIVADRYGRRLSFIVSTAFLSGMGLASALSPNYNAILLIRGLAGFGVGGVPVSFSLLMEILPSAQRGSWGMSLAIFWALGAFFEATIAMFVLPAMGWRWLLTFSASPLFLVLLLSFWLPESPHWLVARGKLQSANQVLTRIARVNQSAMPPGHLIGNLPAENTISESDTHGGTNLLNNNSVRDESDGVYPTSDTEYNSQNGAPHSIGISQTQSDGEDSGIASLLRPGARSLAFKILSLWFVCGFVYYGIVMLQPELISSENAGHRCNYAAKECGLSTQEATCTAEHICSWTSDASCVPTGLLHTRQQTLTSNTNSACARKLTTNDFISTLWGSVGEMPGVVVAFVLIDVIGRRPLFGYMFGSLCAAFIMLLYCLSRIGETAVFFISRGASCGSFQAIYLYTNEIYPSSIRATAMGLSSSTARIGLLITPFVAQFLINIDESLALAVYFLAAAGAFIAILLLPIETTGRPLFSSMDELTDMLNEARCQRLDSGVPFAKDPSAHPLVRFFRWNARIDGIPVK